MRSGAPSASAAILRISRVVRVATQGMCQACPKAESGASSKFVAACAIGLFGGVRELFF